MLYLFSWYGLIYFMISDRKVFNIKIIVIYIYIIKLVEINEIFYYIFMLYILIFEWILEECLCEMIIIC